MKRTRRTIFNTLAVISLLLLLATLGFWVDGVEHSRRYTWLTAKYSMAQIQNGGGSVGILSQTSKDQGTRAWFVRLRFGHEPYYFDTRHSGWWSWFAFDSMNYKSMEWWSLDLPHWFLAFIFAIVPALRFIKWRRLRQRLQLISQGRCPACGYDLTGNKTGMCPECGEATAQPSLSA